MSEVVARARSDLYALKILRSHGMPAEDLNRVCSATLTARLTYASPSWRGFCNKSDIDRLEAVQRKARHWGFSCGQGNIINALIDQADKKLFGKVLASRDHVLHPLLPPVKATTHNLRSRGHDRQLPTKTNLSSCNFIMRMIYSTI